MNIRKFISKSPEQKLKKEIKTSLNQIKNKNISLSKKSYSINISEIYITLYKDAFPQILRQSRSNFLDRINKEAKEIILKSDIKFPNNNEQILDYRKKLIKRYEADYKLLSLEFKNYLKNKTNSYFSHFRKHCEKTEKYGYHYCNINKISRFIEIKQNGEVSYVICEECKICYSTDFILMFCSNCNRRYFSNKLNKNEDENILPATWVRYHCHPLINEIMKCIKCKNILYINLKTGYLMCLNKKCNFTSKAENIIWTCIKCGKEFTSPAKIYNPLEFQILNKSIKFVLIKKIKAAPKKLPCGCTKDLSKLSFYHKEECKGILLKGTLMNKGIIVCDKCHSINFEDKFNWICPLCGIKFHLHNIIGTKPFVKKKYVINRSLGKNENRYKLGINPKKLNISDVSKNILNNTNNANLSSRINGNVAGNNMNIKKIYFRNDLSPINNAISLNSNRNQIENLKENKYSNSNPKKKKYKTLLDILKKRQNSEPKGNIKKEKNNINKIKNPVNNNILKIFPVQKKCNEFFNKNNNNQNKESNKESNKGTYKGISDTTDNSTFKSSSIKEGNKKIYNNNINDNENNDKNKNFISTYKAWKNIYEEKRKNLFNLYKNKNHKLKIIKYQDDYSKQNNSNDNINLTSNINLNLNLDNDKNSFFSFSHLNNNKNITNDNNNNSKQSIKIKGNNFLLYSDRTYNDQCLSSEERINNNIKKTKEFNSSFQIKSSEKSQNSLDKEEEDEKNDSIKDFPIKSSNKKIFRESLILHEISRRQSIVISKEKINDLSNKTKIPFFDENDYNYINQIGEGTYGTVYLVEHNETQERYALKKIICRDYIELTKQKEELELIYSMKHQNILNIYGVQFKYLDETTSSIQILMELAKSDWNKEIKKKFLAKKYYKENEIINILKQIINAFLFLQNENIAHRDIKPQNILLFPNNIYKIADFGEAKFIKNIKEQSTFKGSELFMSPILYKGYKYNQNAVNHNPFKSDVFSIGYCFLYAMCLNLNVLNSLRELTTMKSMINCINKFLIPNLYSKKLIDLVYNMIEPNEDLRYDFEDISNELKNL